MKQNTAVKNAGEPLETLTLASTSTCMCDCEENPCCTAFVVDTTSSLCKLYASQLLEEYHVEQVGALYYARLAINGEY